MRSLVPRFRFGAKSRSYSDRGREGNWRHLLVQPGSCSCHSPSISSPFFLQDLELLSFSTLPRPGQQGAIFKAFVKLQLNSSSSAVNSSPFLVLNSSPLCRVSGELLYLGTGQHPIQGVSSNRFLWLLGIAQGPSSWVCSRLLKRHRKGGVGRPGWSQAHLRRGSQARLFCKQSPTSASPLPSPQTQQPLPACYWKLFHSEIKNHETEVMGPVSYTKGSNPTAFFPYE